MQPAGSAVLQRHLPHVSARVPDLKHWGCGLLVVSSFALYYFIQWAIVHLYLVLILIWGSVAKMQEQRGVVAITKSTLHHTSLQKKRRFAREAWISCKIPT